MRYAAASHALNPLLSRETLQPMQMRFYDDLGADLRRLGVAYDLDPRSGKTPFAYTDFIRIGRWVDGAWRPARVRVSDSVESGGLFTLDELVHESGHAVHIMAIRARPAYFWPDDFLSEAFASTSPPGPCTNRRAGSNDISAGRCAGPTGCENDTRSPCSMWRGVCSRSRCCGIPRPTRIGSGPISPRIISASCRTRIGPGGHCARSSSPRSGLHGQLWRGCHLDRRSARHDREVDRSLRRGKRLVVHPWLSKHLFRFGSQPNKEAAPAACWAGHHPRSAHRRHPGHGCERLDLRVQWRRRGAPII